MGHFQFLSAFRVKPVLNLQIVFMNIACKQCLRIVFANIFVLNTKTAVQELPGSLVRTTDFEASWPAIDSGFK